MPCTNCKNKTCNKRLTDTQQNAVDTAYILEQTTALRIAFNLPMDSDHAADHDHHEQAYRESFQRYKHAMAQYNHTELAESIAECAINLCSYMLDANATMHLEFEPMMQDIFVMGLLHDINVRTAFDIVISSHMTRRIKFADTEATQRHYQTQGISADFIHSEDDLFICYDTATDEQLKPLTYQAPDWSDTQNWTLSQTAA